MKRLRILIADDHTLVAEAVRNLLEPEYDVVKIVADGRDLLATAMALKPDIVLLDLAMPLLNGLDAGDELKRSLPKTKLIVLTMNEDAGVASRILRRTANGYLLKKSAGTELKKAIIAVSLGGSYVTPIIAQKLENEFIRDPNPDRIRRFTHRQREVLQLLAEGQSMKQAAAILNITPRTIAFHKYKLMEEFGLKTHSDLVQFAFRENLLDLSGGQLSGASSRNTIN